MPAIAVWQTSPIPDFTYFPESLLSIPMVSAIQWKLDTDQRKRGEGEVGNRSHCQEKNHTFRGQINIKIGFYFLSFSIFFISEVWLLYEQHEHYLTTCLKCKLSGSLWGLLNQKLLGGDPVKCFNKLSRVLIYVDVWETSESRSHWASLQLFPCNFKIVWG